MTRFERRLLLDTGFLGIVLTVLVAVLDRAGFIKPLEWFLDDLRARKCQFFTPKPTDQLIFLDIDDASLDAVGGWPWPRQNWAQILDEVSLAGARTVGMDTLFVDPQRPSVEEQGKPPVDHDRLFADALERFRDRSGGASGVLLPIKVEVNDLSAQSDVWKAMVEEYDREPELESLDVLKKLQARGINPPDLPQQIAKGERGALEEALFHRVRSELNQHRSMDLESLRADLLPRSFATGVRSEAVLLLAKVTPRVEAFQELLRSTRPLPGGLPPLLTGSAEAASIPVLSKSASYAGFVDLWQVDDGKVRMIPLWLLDRGRMVPQFGLALACATLGVNVNDVRLSPTSVVIPRPNGNDIVIPVHSRQDTQRGEVGMLMDIPWFGTTDWRTMFDYPEHLEVKQHLPVNKIWDICKIEPDIENNNRKALEAVAVLGGSQADADRVMAHHPAFNDVEGWNKLMADTLDNQPPGTLDDYKPYLEGAESLDKLTDPRDRGTVIALRNLLQRPKVNATLFKERTQLREDLRRQLFGRTVLIGWLGTGGVDFRPTPLHKECPGVVVHGAIFNAIMTRCLLHRAPEWVPVALTLLVGLVTTFVSARFPPWRALVSAGVVAAAFLAVNFLGCYDWGKTEVDAAGPVAAAAMIWSGCTLTRFIRESTEKARITNRFRSYVDPSLVNYVLEHPEKATLQGEERELTVVFTDLQGFTSVSEKLKRDTVPLLNEYLGLMEPAIRKNHGLVNKFLGDGIMFFFGAPEPHPDGPLAHAAAAVRTVLEMQQVMIPFNVELKQRGLPPLKMRAGVSTGDMVVGDAGTPNRSDYTVLGDRVNFAARLESANKATGTLILLSDRTAELLGDRYLVRPIGRLQVVGKKEPVMTYEPLALVEAATDEMRKLVAMTRIVTDSFIAMQFNDCLAATHELLEAFGEASQGKLCALYRRLCLEHIKNPPQEFLGQIKLEEK